MNLDEMKKNSVNSVELVDSLHAPLLEFKVALTTSSTIPTESDLKIFVDDHETDETNRKTIIYTLSKPLQYVNGVTDKFILEPVFKGNMVQMKAYVERNINQNLEGGLEVLEMPIIEELTYQPILMFSSYNRISTNYENAELSLLYPKNTDFVKYFLISSFSYSLNNEDKFLTLDDIYFKNCFTETEEGKINAEFNKLTIKCLNSSNNNFSLDCDGNLVVNSITTKVQDESSSNIDFDQIYPVGSIYLSVSATNPGILFGGSWEAFAAGKTLVGIDANQEEFNTVNKIGGEKKHTLTIDEMPSHDHKRPNSILYNGNSSWWIGGAGGTTIEVVETPTSTSGGNQAHNNLQPYITIYMWKRVA